MAEQRFGARRCRDSRKPLEKQCPDIIFHRCMQCGALFQITGHKPEAEREIQCCGLKALEVPIHIESDNIEIQYKITGGYNDNAIKVSWKAISPEYQPEWIYLKTFTGGYLKYIQNQKQSTLVFALADTDAFAYCDEDPCLECVFRCKRGFIIYVYTVKAGLVKVPIDKFTPHWQSGANHK